VRDVRLYGIDTIIVALPPAAERQLVETLNKLTVVPVDVRLSAEVLKLRARRATSAAISSTSSTATARWRWTPSRSRILGALIWP
jgi:hypothetical protein